ncbi:MAG: hypothetical protein WC477_05920 [Patescibacteria group bacterium]
METAKKKQLKVTITLDGTNATIDIYYNDRPIPNLCGFEISYGMDDEKQGVARAKRLVTNKFGQYRDQKDGKKETEIFELLELFDDRLRLEKIEEDTHKEIENALANIRATSALKAEQLIKERGAA